MKTVGASKKGIALYICRTGSINCGAYLTYNVVVMQSVPQHVGEVTWGGFDFEDLCCCTSIFVCCFVFLFWETGVDPRLDLSRDLSNNRLVAIPPNLFVLLGDLLQL